MSGVEYFQKLTDVHKKAARMRLDGASNDDIAKECKVTKKRVMVWWCDDKMQDYLNELAQNVEQIFAEKLATAGMHALSTLTGILDKPSTDASASDHLKLEVARELMDRLPGTTRVRERHDPAKDIPQLVQIFAQMPDADLLHYIQTGGKLPESKPVIDA